MTSSLVGKAGAVGPVGNTQDTYGVDERGWAAVRRVGRVIRLPRTRAGRRRAVQAVMLLCTLALLPSTWMFTAAA